VNVSDVTSSIINPIDSLTRSVFNVDWLIDILSICYL
jgi:hypothetical protein